MGFLDTLGTPNSTEGFLGNLGSQTVKTPASSDNVWSKLASVGRGIGNALTSSEQGVGGEIAAGLPASITGEKMLNQANQSNAVSDIAFIEAIHDKRKAGRPVTPAQQAIYDHILQSHSSVGTQADLLPHATDTNLQGIGNTLGVGLDVLSAGSYGDVVKGAKELATTGSLANDLEKTGTLASKVAAPIVQQTVKQTLGGKLKDIGTKTLARVGIGAGTGFAYDVSNNLKEGKTGIEAATPGLGTILGGSVPLVVGGIQAGVALTKESAPRFINSLIKPKQADFSYGKDPGRTVSEMGITGNSLPDFANNIRTARQDIGSQIGSIYSAPENAGLRVNVSPEIAKIDTAIQDAAKGGRSNQAVVTALQNAKDALLYEHQVNVDGVIEKVGTTPRNLTNLSPQEAFDLKQLVSGQTKFTGNPSDDKTVNSVLKNIYGGIKEKLNSAVGVNNPEIIDLNQKYADLTSAELATTHRDQIVKRADLISMPIKVGGATALITALSTGGAAVPALVAGASAAALDKALQSTAVKTRVAAWLGSESPSKITAILKQNPAIGEVLYRALPKFASQLGR